MNCNMWYGFLCSQNNNKTTIVNNRKQIGLPRLLVNKAILIPSGII